MSLDPYNDYPGLRWSLLKHIGDSPLHFRHAEQQTTAQTPSLVAGRYVHTAALQPERLHEDFVIWTDGDRRGAKYKQFAEHEHRDILKTAEEEPLKALVERVRPVLKRFLSPTAQIEQACGWADPATGVLCKAKPDLADPAASLLLDLKTAQHIDERRFGRAIATYRYHGQMAFYAEGLAANGWRPQRYVIVAVETSAPYDVAVFELDPGIIEIGAQMARDYLELLAECRTSGVYPGRYPEPVQLTEQHIPSWEMLTEPTFEFTGGV